jgi:hypothetical protein
LGTSQASQVGCGLVDASTLKEVRCVGGKCDCTDEKEERNRSPNRHHALVLAALHSQLSHLDTADPVKLTLVVQNRKLSG